MVDLRQELATLLRAADTLNKSNNRNKPIVPSLNKKQFLTIPEFPNYEINGCLKVRNKRTGKFIKRLKHDKTCVHLVRGEFTSTRSRAKVYTQAKCALCADNNWAKIISTTGLYEINRQGLVRNSRTRHLLRPIIYGNHQAYRFCVKGKRHQVQIQALLNECFGENYKPKKSAVAVILKKDNLAHSFKTMTAAAKWLSPKVFLGVWRILWLMSKRRAEIFGYKVSYFPKKAFKEIKL